MSSLIHSFAKSVHYGNLRDASQIDLGCYFPCDIAAHSLGYSDLPTIFQSFTAPSASPPIICFTSTSRSQAITDAIPLAVTAGKAWDSYLLFYCDEGSPFSGTSTSCNACIVCVDTVMAQLMVNGKYQPTPPWITTMYLNNDCAANIATPTADPDTPPNVYGADPYNPSPPPGTPQAKALTIGNIAMVLFLILLLNKILFKRGG